MRRLLFVQKVRILFELATYATPGGKMFPKGAGGPAGWDGGPYGRAGQFGAALASPGGAGYRRSIGTLTKRIDMIDKFRTVDKRSLACGHDAAASAAPK